VRFVLYATIVIGLGWVGHTHGIGMLSCAGAGLMVVALAENRASQEKAIFVFQPAFQIPDIVREAAGWIYAVAMAWPFLLNTGPVHRLADAATASLDPIIPLIDQLRYLSTAYGFGDPTPFIISIKLGFILLPLVFVIRVLPSLIAATRGDFSISYKSHRALIAPGAIGLIVALFMADILLGTAGYLFLGVSKTPRDGILFQAAVVLLFWVFVDNTYPKLVAVIIHLASRQRRRA